MPIGEAPITSYFSRAPSKKYHKNTGSAFKRKRVEEDSDDEVQVVKKQVVLPFSKATGNKSAQTTSHTGPSIKRDPHTPRRLNRTPSHTVPIASSSLSSPIIDLTSPPPKRHRPATREGKSVAFASPPLEPAYETAGDDVLFVEPFKNPKTPGLLFALSQPESVEDNVPSSQSQHLTLSQPSQGRDEPSTVEFVPSSQSQYLLPRLATISRSAEEDDHYIVPSSQSQWLVPNHPDIGNDDEDVVVQSSQSQSQWLRPNQAEEPEPVEEDERTREGQDERSADLLAYDQVIPSSQSDSDTELAPKTAYRSPNRARRKTGTSSQPERDVSHTAAEDLRIDLADIFESPVPETGAPPREEQQNSSATESDDEFPLMLPQPSKSAQRSSPPAEVRSSQDDLAGGRTFPDIEGSIESSQGSLPSAMKDFYDMLGSSQGSYPSSFPQSLRGGWSRDPTQVALITGAGSGIGLESSILFAQEGASVLLVDINLEGAEKGAAIIGKRFPNVKAVATKADVGKEEDIKAAVDLAVQTFGRLDVMFNNAGIMHPADDNALNTEERIWDLTMTINLKGVWWGCKYAILAMRNNPTDESKGLHTGGSIINTASFVALMGAATPQLAYTASKGGVLAMTRELAMVHAKEGIRINSLCPGPLKTPLLMDFLNTPEKRDRRMIHLPMGRFGEAVELAKAALFLASDDSSYMTGTDFKVDGGLSSAYVTALGEPVLPPPSSLIG
ncbi:NAD(P)-binding protein [Favolaschia claudopus]|uniref:NAD(P)-binding protein n=1 Tax=Favolaschia claudopus TaxID=2862362 RepID=A0AAW0EAN5_9AGAR